MADPEARSRHLGAHGYAQTNLQLYNQLLALGWNEAELTLLRRGYELGTLLFAGGYRPSGKTLLAHGVGTASILAELALPAHVVAAGLLHAAYTHGRFEEGETGPGEAHRARVSDAVGAEAEALVARYRALVWNAHTIDALHGAVAVARSGPAADRELVALRLANELEDHLDLGMLYSGEHRYHALYRGPAARQVVEIAEGLQLPALARALERAFAETRASSRPAGLRRRERFVHFTRP